MRYFAYSFAFHDTSGKLCLDELPFVTDSSIIQVVLWVSPYMMTVWRLKTLVIYQMS